MTMALMAAELHKFDINAVLMDSDIDLIADIIDTMFRAAVARAENMADRRGKKVQNIDRIKVLSVDMLADLLDTTKAACPQDYFDEDFCAEIHCDDYGSCVECISDWLGREVDDNGQPD